jgi:hypothetical protein
MKKWIVVLVAALSLAVAMPVMANGGGNNKLQGAIGDGNVGIQSNGAVKDNLIMGGGNNVELGNKNNNHHNATNSFNTGNSKTGIFGNRVKDSFNDNSTNIKIKDSLNHNQLGLVNQKGQGNQQGLVNVKGKKNQTNAGVVGTGIIGNKNHHNVIGGSGGEYGEGGDAQQQGQKQGQMQGQIQGQAQSANNKQGQKQSVDIKFEADKREHIGGHAAPVADAKVANTKASKIRGKGSLLDRVRFLTMSMAKRASKDASDMDVETAVLFENDFELDKIRVGTGEVFGGYIYVFADGTDCYLAAMDAEASEVAMKLGMTHIIRLGEVELTKVLDGSSWNIGFSGGASLMTSGEDVAIAPNGGLGFGKARTSSEFRPDAVYEVSYSADLIIEK